MFVRAINLSIRAITLISKFLLIYFMAIFLEPKDVGFYGLFFITITYSIYILGFEFFTYSTREIASSDKSYWFTYIRDQSAFTICCYLITIPILLSIFYFKLLPLSIIYWFFSLLILEHLSQEIYRLLVAMSMQLQASMVLFLRSGLWGLILVVVIWLKPETRSLETVFLFWLFGLLSAVLLGFNYLLNVESKKPTLPISWAWIKKGIKIAFPLLIASLALRGLFTFDRFWIDIIAEKEVLAAYVLFAGIANAVYAFVDASVIVFFLPKVIIAAKEDTLVNFKVEMHSMAVQIILVSVVLIYTALYLSYFLLDFLTSHVYGDNFYFIYWALGSIFIFVIGLIPHVALYALGRDKMIIYSQVIALIIFFICALFLSRYYQVVGILFSLMFSFFIMTALKTSFMLYIYKDTVK